MRKVAQRGKSIKFAQDGTRKEGLPKSGKPLSAKESNFISNAKLSAGRLRERRNMTPEQKAQYERDMEYARNLNAMYEKQYGKAPAPVALPNTPKPAQKSGGKTKKAQKGGVIKSKSTAPKRTMKESGPYKEFQKRFGKAQKGVKAKAKYGAATKKASSKRSK